MSTSSGDASTLFYTIINNEKFNVNFAQFNEAQKSMS